MPAPIRPLDALVIDKIAAGEVVERPAFAIKELIENSIDAGATAVTVEVRDGGLTYFRVTDNGHGIARGDIRLAFARFATSKLRSAEELESIHTLGFRGEALASIAAVSRVELTTRTAGDAHGVKAIVSGGVIERLDDAASPEGTSVVVRDLFFNTPARKKFLKKPATEAGLVSDLVMRLMLARPDISFRLVGNERQIYHSPGNGSLREAMFSVLGRDAVANLVEVRGSAAGCAVNGFVGVGEASRSTRAMQTFILNGRYVRNAILSQALDDACRERVMAGKHPVCALHLTMPFEAVDVNVHPNKLEVRFQDERALLEGLVRVIRAAFETEPLRAAPRIETEPPQKPKQALTLPEMPPIIQADRPSVRLHDAGLLPPLQTDRPSVGTSPEPIQEQISLPELQASTETLRILGVAWEEYIVAEQGDALYLIDQHAAHERVLYERFCRALDTETVSQQMLTPQVIELSHREHAALMANLSLLSAIGFDIDDDGGRAIRVRAVPSVLGMPQIKPFFGEMADRLGEYRSMPTSDLRRDALVKLACRKAVKAGDSLEPESVAALIAQMLETGAPPTCPHGRPLVIALNKRELDKRFRRIV